jgi:ATP-dependent exoDNAse (exonuclease V) beta subunit
LRSWVEGVWLALGGPLCLPDAAAVEDVGVFFEFLQGFEAAGRTVTRERLLDGAEQLFSLPDPQADERLQLMTIHKAKGLEFDTVILPGLGRRPRSDDRRLLYWLETTADDGSAELFFGPVRSAGSAADPRTSAYIRNLESDMGRLESGRLLYVAATRARRRLHLLGHAAPGRRDGLCSPDGASLLACLWPAVQAHWEPLHRDPADQVREIDAAVYRAGAGSAPLRVPSGWVCPPPPSPAGLASSPTEVGEEPVVYEWAGATARIVGTVVHRFLQRLAETGAAGLDELPNFDAVARRQLLSEGLPERELDGALRRVRGALQNALDDARGRWILSSQHAERGNELPLTAVVDGRVRRLVVDRSFVDEEGTRWIIDYKTGTHEGSDVEGFLDREEARYRAQLLAYAAAFGALEDRPLRMALYYPLVSGGWRELQA